MSWIKIQTTLARSPKIRQLARLLKVKRHAAIGLAVDWFSWLDVHSIDGCTKLMPEDVDDELDLKGATKALIAIGWLELDCDGFVCAVDFDSHNGATAKGRATEARKKANQRGTKKGKKAEQCPASVPESVPIQAGQKRDMIGELEKEKEYNNTLSGKATVNEVATRQPASEIFSDARFGSWLASLCQVNPSASRMRSLPPEVTGAAWRMFETGFTPTTEELALLERFYAATLKVEDEKRKVWRPRKLEQYFGQLPDVITSATEWAKFWGISLKATSKKKEQDAPALSAEELEARRVKAAQEWDKLKKEGGFHQ